MPNWSTEKSEVIRKLQQHVQLLPNVLARKKLWLYLNVGGIFSLKEQTTPLQNFLGGQHVSHYS